MTLNKETKPNQEDGAGNFRASNIIKMKIELAKWIRFEVKNIHI